MSLLRQTDVATSLWLNDNVIITSCVRLGGVALVVAILPHGRQWSRCLHYSDVIMSAMRLKSPASRLFVQPFFSGADQRKHQSSTPLAFVWGIHRWLLDSPHKGPVTRKMFPFDDVIMLHSQYHSCWWLNDTMSYSFLFYFTRNLISVIANCLYSTNLWIKAGMTYYLLGSKLWNSVTIESQFKYFLSRMFETPEMPL